MRTWKKKFQQYCWDLIIYRIYREGLKFKADNVKKVASKVSLTTGYLHMIIRSGRDGFKPDCSTIHQILEKYDPVEDTRFMFHPKNIWSRTRARKEGAGLR